MPKQTAGIRAIDAFNPFDPGFDDALAGGVTTVNVNRGSGDPIPQRMRRDRHRLPVREGP